MSSISSNPSVAWDGPASRVKNARVLKWTFRVRIWKSMCALKVLPEQATPWCKSSFGNALGKSFSVARTRGVINTFHLQKRTSNLLAHFGVWK